MSDHKNFYKNYFQIFRSIELCIENKLILPALTLIYIGIDTFAWVAYGDIATKTRFVRWVENYMYKAKKLWPRPIDLYAARCAILHTLTPYSDLSKSKQAIPLAYAWGNAETEGLERNIETLMPDQLSCVHLNDLFESFKLGVVDFLERSCNDFECKARMTKNYSQLNKEVIDNFNNES
jgi:hypothetical protein